MPGRHGMKTPKPAPKPAPKAKPFGKIAKGKGQRAKAIEDRYGDVPIG